MYQYPPSKEIERRLAQGKPEEIAEAVEGLIHFFKEAETMAALGSNLNSDQRHYNAGRAAALADFLDYFKDAVKTATDKHTKIPDIE